LAGEEYVTVVKIIKKSFNFW